MYDERPGRKKQKDEQAQGRTDFAMKWSGDKGCVCHCANRML